MSLDIPKKNISGKYIPMDIKSKKLTEIERVSLYWNETKDGEITKEKLLVKLKKLSFKTQFGIYNFVEEYEYEIPRSFDDIYSQFNTVIVATLPYCIHVPNGLNFSLKNSTDEVDSNIIFDKIWSPLAQGSSEDDFVSEEKTTFLNGGNITSPTFPIKLDKGWQQQNTCTDMEGINERNGTFRYSKVEIYINLTEEELKKDSNAIIDEIKNKAINSINSFLNVYRYYSQEFFVESLGDININDVYIPKLNRGFYVSSLGSGISSAKSNIPFKKVKDIKKMLETGISPNLYELLQMSAESSILRHEYTLAIVQSFQSFEIFLESFLREGYKKKSYSNKKIKEILSNTWKARDRLQKPLKEIINKSITSEPDLWEDWKSGYTARNKLIHEGKEISKEDSIRYVIINNKVISWINSHL